MASLSSNINRIGIISEDSTDFESLRILISKSVDVEGIGFRSKVGNGCAKIRSKCVVWAEDLKNRNCDMLIVVHDLDERNHDELLIELSKKLSDCAISKHFVSIPIEEIEAWLLSDPTGLKAALNLRRTPKFTGKPETINKPKEKLRDAIFSCSGNEIYYQPTMNPRIAEHLDIDIIKDKCPSFNRLVEFLQSYAT